MLKKKGDRHALYALVCVAVLAAADAQANDCPRTGITKITPASDGMLATFNDKGEPATERFKPPTTKQELADIRIVACRDNSNGREIFKLKLKTREVWLLASAIDLEPPPKIVCSEPSQERGQQTADRGVSCHDENKP